MATPLANPIRTKLAQSNAIDRRSVENDIAARRLEAEAAHEWALRRDKIIAECKRRRISEDMWCRKELDCGIGWMRRRLQLWERFDIYETRRIEGGVGAGWGLMFALALIADYDSRTDASSARTRSDYRPAVSDPAQPSIKIDILQGDCLRILRTLEAESVQCVVTSPPYFNLRNYETAYWIGGDPDCEHVSDQRRYTERGASSGSSEAFSKPGRGNADRLRKARWRERGHCVKCGAKYSDQQIGLEATVEEYVEKLVRVMREVHRSLRPNGVAFLNIGDTYGDGGRGGGRPGDMQFTNKSSRRLHSRKTSLGPKQLLLIPHRVAIALQSDGWVIRSDIIWAKRNPMPESVRDRCTSSHEHVLVLAKSKTYYWNQDAVREPATGRTEDDLPQRIAGFDGKWQRDTTPGHQEAFRYESDTRNARDVWTDRGEHYRRQIADSDLTAEQKARAQVALNKAIADVAAGQLSDFRMKIAGVHRHRIGEGGRQRQIKRDGFAIIEFSGEGGPPDVWWLSSKPFRGGHFAVMPLELAERCIKAATRPGDTVLDPFAGIGTTGLAADNLGCAAILIELNQEYVKLAKEQLGVVDRLSVGSTSPPVEMAAD